MFDQGSGNAHKAQFKMPEPASNSARPATPDNLQNSNSSGQGQGMDDGKGKICLFFLLTSAQSAVLMKLLGEIYYLFSISWL